MQARQWSSQVAAISATDHFRLVARADQRAFLGLPWTLPLEEWPDDLVVEVARGIGATSSASST
jgi:hypothetical protein